MLLLLLCYNAVVSLFLCYCSNFSSSLFVLILHRLAAVNIAIDKDNKKVVAKNCRVIRVAGGGQHSLMVIKRYL